MKMFAARTSRLARASLAVVAAAVAVVALAGGSVLAFAGGRSQDASGDTSQQVPAPAQIPRSAQEPSSGSQPSITQGVWLWLRSEYSNDTSVASPDPSKYTLSFQADGRLALQVDCNRGTGRYTQNGAQLTVDPGATTLIACPPGSQDQVFLRDLRNVATYVFDGENLVLNLKVDGGNMIFSPQPPISLTGAAWRVVSYNNGQNAVLSVLPDVELNATFGADGNVTGNGGCNGYRGPYSIAGDRITFGNLISTRRACVSEPLNRQERAFLDALSASSAYTLVGDRLTLRDPAGATQVILVRPTVQPVPSPATGTP
jgi:heat shock protein HslJ